MNGLDRVLGFALAAALAGSIAHATEADSRRPHLERQQALSTARAARDAEQARVARLRWEQERRRSAARARMPDTMYASTPSRPAAELSCPVPDQDVRRAMQGFTSADDLSSPPLLSQDWLGSQDGGVFRSPPLAGAFGSSSGSDAAVGAVAHDAWSPASPRPTRSICTRRCGAIWGSRTPSECGVSRSTTPRTSRSSGRGEAGIW